MAITLNLEEREDKKGRQLLRAGKTPCVILTKGESKSYQADSIELRKALVSMKGKVLPITLNIDGKEVVSYVNDMQRNALGDVILHVDFFAVAKGRSLTLHVPIVISGTAKGVQSGGRIRTIGYDLKVTADSTKFPESVTIDVTDLDVDQKIKVKDVKIADVRILDVAERALVSVTK